MKKIVIITLTLIILNVNVFAHKQEMHQYITREAFDLLKMSFPAGFTGLDEMENYLGYDEGTNSNLPFKSLGELKIVAGAWMEDEWDIVYNYGSPDIPDYQGIQLWLQNTIWPIVGIFDGDARREAHVSITHFWDADNGGETATTFLNDTLWYGGDPYVWGFTISENSMQKIRRYYNGNYVERRVHNWLITYNSQRTMATDWELPGIIDIYSGIGEAVLVGYHNQRGQYIDNPDPYIEQISDWYDWWRNGFVYNRFGRMCHLLQDMSVPAHVHNTSHAGPSYEMYVDFFENHEMDYLENYHAWTASEIYNEFGSMIDPYAHDDPLYYLMYFMNQITDHYADGKVNGDDNYDSSIPGLSSVIPTLGAPTITSEINETNCQAMYDVLIPYAIRVTAGLMYWFAVETDQIDPLPEPVLVSGNVSLNGGNGDITSVSIKFDSQSYGINNVYLNPDENGNFSHVFNSVEFDTYDVTYKLYSATGDYYLVPINDVVINTPLTLPDVTLHPITDPTNLIVSNNPNITNAFRNIQDAVDYLSAHNSGTINILSGTYTGERNKNISWFPDMQPDGLHITIRGFGECIIDCGGSGIAFHFDLPSYYQYNENDIIDNLTIQNANQGIVIDYGSPVIKNNIIENCSISSYSDLHGAGIYCASSATIENNTIRNNTANWADPPDSKSLGGGIYVENNTSSTTFIKNNFVSGNCAWNGGGIYCTGSGVIILDGNNVTANTLVEGSGSLEYPDYGTGIYCENADIIYAKNNLLYGNYPYHSNGRTLYISCNNAVIENNTVIDNSFDTGMMLNIASSATIRNNIVSNNKWGINRIGGIPLTVNYSCVSNNEIYNYDTGITQGVGCLAEDVNPNLDDAQNYLPIWNSTTKSPCIDTGDPTITDDDNTPSDIGAIPAVIHKYDTVELPPSSVDNGWKWLSFPALDNVLNYADIAENVLDAILDPTLLSRVEAQDYSIYLNGLIWEHDYELFQRTEGFKFLMNDETTLEVPGFKEPDNTTIDLIGGNPDGNWIGYWLEETQSVEDAFNAYWDGDNITSIVAQHWSAAKFLDTWFYRVESGYSPTLSYGDMVIVHCNTTITNFSWDSSTPEDPKVVFSESTHFTYEEQADYIPLFIEVDPNDIPKEIGAMVDGECIGATTVTDSMAQIRAYASNVPPGDIELELYYGNRSENKRLTSYKCISANDPHTMNAKIRSDKGHEAYFITLREDSNVIPEVYEFTAFNYPNPFNPTTTIAYSLSNDGMADLRIYNIKGQLVKTLVKGEQQAGTYEVVWNGKDNNQKSVSSGIYFYKLSTKDDTIMKKMLMLK